MKTDPTPEQIMRALQYLYYTGDGINRLKGTPVSDRAYDLFCESHNLVGNGGSDRERDYPREVVAIAERLKSNPSCFNHLI